MTKPTPKPTVAILQRELAAAERRAQDAERERLKTLDHSVVLAEERDAAKALAKERGDKLNKISAHLRALLDYFSSGWIGDKVRADFAALVAFAKEGGNG